MAFKTDANLIPPSNAGIPEGSGKPLTREWQRSITNDGQTEVNFADFVCEVTDPNSGAALNVNVTDGDPGFSDNFVSLNSIANAEKKVLFKSNYDAGFDNVFDWKTVFNGLYVLPSRNASEVNGNDSIGPADINQSRLPLLVDAAGAAGDVWKIFSNNPLKVSDESVTYIERKRIFQPVNSAPGNTQFSINTYNEGTATAILQSFWNIDIFDGSGSTENPSGIQIDWTKNQTLVLEISNKDRGVLRVGFKIDNNYYFAHEFKSNNSEDQLAFGNLNLPLLEKVSRTASAVFSEVGLFDEISGVSFQALTLTSSTPTAILEYYDYSTVAYSVGVDDKELKSPYTADMGPNYVTADNFGVLLFALRPKQQLSGVDNKTVYSAGLFNASSRTPNLDDEVLVELWWNAGGADGGTWEDLSYYSGLEINFSSTGFNFTFAIKLGSIRLKGSMADNIDFEKILDKKQNEFSISQTTFNASPLLNTLRGTIVAVVRAMPGNSATEPVLVSASLTGGEVA